MKNLNYIFVFLLLFSAKCEDDDKLSNPIDQLPPATQTGAQTFGCLINGEPFVPPVFGRNAPNAFYQFARGAYTLGISASNGGGSEMLSINFGGIDVDPIMESEYSLKEKISGNYFGQFTIQGGILLNEVTTIDNPGFLRITRMDGENFIISGTFEFTVFDDDGNENKITDGRFDLNYTN